MLISNLCPTFKLCSFIAIMSFIQIFYFLLTIIFSNALGPQFLEPDVRTLISFGAKYTYALKYKFQIWRFITPLLLHGSFMHLFSNFITQMIFGVALEPIIGGFSMIFLYFLSGFGGVLLSSLANDNISVGASTALFGIFACYISYFIMNWDALRGLGSYRYMFLCFILVIMFLNLLSGAFAENAIDNWGHFGGLLTGFLLGFRIVKPIVPGESQRKFRFYSTMLLIGILVICFVCFYTINDPQPLLI